MSLDRRTFLQLAAMGTVAGASGFGPGAATAAIASRFKAVAFDGLAVFDPRPIATLAEELFPGQGKDLMALWRARQFEYQWLRAISGHYADFLQATDDALQFAVKSLHLELSAERRSQLVQAHLGLKAWPDVAPALTALKGAGVRLAILSNMTPRMLDTGIESAGLEGMFEHVLSTDRVRSYKPDPRAYQMATDALRLQRDEIAFVAFAGWDVSGAKWFGYPTYWSNRLGQPAEELGVSADAESRDLAELASFVKLPQTS